MSGIDLVRNRLIDYPDLEITEGNEWLTVIGSPGGFNATIRGSGEDSVVSAGLWHEHFDDSESAADCFCWLLTPLTRIVERRKGKHVVSARLERNEGSNWVSLGQTTLMIQNPFVRPTEIVLQNNLITKERPQ
ncbi:MAG: hypothetical protein ABL962_11810 [Fimbriimonadaceae bacterium]